jgi:hypothetical protein
MVLKEHQSPEAEGSLLDNDSSSQDHCLKFGGCELRALKRYRSGAFPVVQDRSAGGAILPMSETIFRRALKSPQLIFSLECFIS